MAAALCSGLIEESRSGDAAVARLFLKKRPKIKRQLQEMDVADRVAGTFLAGAPIVPVSSTTGEGIDQLRAALRTRPAVFVLGHGYGFGGGGGT